MSLLSKFINEHVLTYLEKEFQSFEPILQAKLLEEVKLFSDEVNIWLTDKLQNKAE